jgi:NAD(P)-dependent dehydrogenase (short-subunit alcohol dehydrogenase family)
MAPPAAFTFTDEVAIVTGAGSRMSGISSLQHSSQSHLTGITGEIGNGRATAILLARQGAKVVLVDYNRDWANETKKMIEAEGAPGEAIVVQADVTEEESCKRVVETTVKEFGGVSILVNIGMFLTPSLDSEVVYEARGIRTNARAWYSGCWRRNGRRNETRSRSLGERLQDQCYEYGSYESLCDP